MGKKNIPASTKEKRVYERVKCRFRRNENQNWSTGKLLVGLVNKDESLTILDSTGNMRAVEAEYVQVQEIGPRGGRTWVPYVR